MLGARKTLFCWCSDTKLELCQDKLKRKLFVFWLQMSHEGYKAGALNENHMLHIKIFRRSWAFEFLPKNEALQAEAHTVVGFEGRRDRHKAARQREDLVLGLSRPSPQGEPLLLFFPLLSFDVRTFLAEQRKQFWRLAFLLLILDLKSLLLCFHDWKER